MDSVDIQDLIAKLVSKKMKKNLIIILTILALASNALAGTEFTGVWRGSGSAVDHNGLTYPGCQFLLKLQQTDTQFAVAKASYDCGDLKANLSPFSLDIRNNELFYQNEKIGSIETNSIKARFADKNLTTYYDMLIIDSDNLDLQQTLFNNEQPNIYLMLSGNLKKQ